MAHLYPNITVENDEASVRGETLENCSPLQWPGVAGLDEAFVKLLITRLLAASYRPPQLLPLFALPSDTITKILRQANVVFSNEPNVVDVIVPHEGTTHVFGDVHGDIHSLMNALNQAGLPSASNRLVFAGDYVDRGPWGVEVIAIIFTLKAWQPDAVTLLRGNHETVGCASSYGFVEEVKHKYGLKMVHSFSNTFRNLPLAAVVRILPPLPSSVDPSQTRPNQGFFSGKAKARSSNRRVSRSKQSESQYPWSGSLELGERRFVVMHGGLFRKDSARKDKRMEVAPLTDLMYAIRREDDPSGNMVEDVLWSDPQLAHNGIVENRLRGCGVLFGSTTLEYFLRNNNLHGVIRAHEGPDMREQRPEMPSIQDGYSVDIEVSAGFLVTVFSTANYPIQRPRGNKGAFVTFYGKSHERNGSMPTFTTFDRLEPPADVHLFYTVEQGSCCTPRTSFSTP